MKHLRLTGAAVALSLLATMAIADPTGSSPFATASMPGFRLVQPSYRASGDGTAVSVLVCRVIGWAGSSPGLIHFLRAGDGTTPAQHHDVYLSRVGLRGGENCERVTTRFDGSPRPVEQINICIAYSHHRCEAAP